ncbi:transposase family protein [Streptomyces sp. NPDC004284]|uniref:transposase family protein n=1 Tax=Streptomyces sp. NPDC004284 TaxID=3364695 RepID=UPI003698A8B4
MRPGCGCFSDRVHDRYQRRLKDLPLVEQGSVIRLMVRRGQPAGSYGSDSSLSAARTWWRWMRMS